MCDVVVKMTRVGNVPKLYFRAYSPRMKEILTPTRSSRRYLEMAFHKEYPVILLHLTKNSTTGYSISQSHTVVVPVLEGLKWITRNLQMEMKVEGPLKFGDKAVYLLKPSGMEFSLNDIKELDKWKILQKIPSKTDRDLPLSINSQEKVKQKTETFKSSLADTENFSSLKTFKMNPNRMNISDDEWIHIVNRSTIKAKPLLKVDSEGKAELIVSPLAGPIYDVVSQWEFVTLRISLKEGFKLLIEKAKRPEGAFKVLPGDAKFAEFTKVYLSDALKHFVNYPWKVHLEYVILGDKILFEISPE